MNFEHLRHPFRPPDSNILVKETASEIPTHIKFEGIRRQALEIGRNRLLVTGALFTLAFAVIAGRLVELAVVEQIGEEARSNRIAATSKMRKVRSDITDRNGIFTGNEFANRIALCQPATHT